MDLDQRIFYIVVVPDGLPEQASIMQGFAPSLMRNARLVQAASYLPSTVYDLTKDGQDTLIARRVAGQDPVNWFGQTPRAIRSMPTPPFAPFTVILLGSSQDPREYDEWIATCSAKPTIVAQKGGHLTYEELNAEALRKRFLAALDELPAEVDANSIAQAKWVLENWVDVPDRDIGYHVGGHNCITPNLMVMASVGYRNVVDHEFDDTERGNAPYIEQIVKTSRSVLDLRAADGQRDMHRIFRPTFDLNLYAPAIYPQFFDLPAPRDASADERRRFALVREAMQRQTGYNYFNASESAKRALHNLDLKTGEPIEGRPPGLHFLIGMRRDELNIGTKAVAALATSEFAPVIRLPNDVNRTGGLVRTFAQQYRAASTTSRKRLLAFRQVQERMKTAVPTEFIEFIRGATVGVRIIADAHVEWLDVDGLPLCIRKDTARLPVTPGNLFIDQIGMKPPIHLTPKDLQHVLVLSALKRDDPIAKMFDIAFDAFGPHWKANLKVDHVDVSNADELVGAINAFEGQVLVFDGHGAHRDKQAAALYLHDEPIDVWTLRDRITQMPPIVLLSACDTHAADRNHATVGNGFLALGARAVLASVFPLFAPTAAAFIARLLYRISAFVEVAINIRQRSVTWVEIVSGMIRMQLLSDLNRALEDGKRISSEIYVDIGSRGNAAINGEHEDPFAAILQMYEESGVPRADLDRVFELTIANSSAISYLHLGRPETILIDLPGRIEEQFKQIAKQDAG
ncbi:CHAT domain-containing protein [Bradyrhizobium diazoefficiens]|nr:CHAT domain-containing protein [Bradyrhizobium diazoefficiens]MBR0927602.1 CHAT domain-containing protein [Bradyrhizobium diazoefficiens]